MHNNALVVMDGLSKVILIPMIFISLVIRKILKIFHRNNNGKILFIKLMGAGNLVACRGFMLERDVEILTSLSNKSTVEKFNLAKKAHYIDTSSLLNLFKSIPPLLRLYRTGTFVSIVNMESESIFAKFLAASVPAMRTTGMTNVYRSLLDHVLYNRYLVAPMLLPKSEALEMLFSDRFEANSDMACAIRARQERFFVLNSDKLELVNSVVITPSCSSTDKLRRLPNEVWVDFLIHLKIERFQRLDVVFPDEKDLQFEFFSETLTKTFPFVNVVVSDYKGFVNLIASTDLLLTIDSQALHVAQQFGTLAFAFYGPTSPYGVDLAATTLPLTRSFKCSPCTHKYFVTPCAGRAHCMNFERDFESINFFEMLN